MLLHQGRNQQVRRMFELIGHSVLKLRRVRIGFLTDEGLKPAHWRFLAPSEVSRLMKPQANKSQANKSQANKSQAMKSQDKRKRT